MYPKRSTPDRDWPSYGYSDFACAARYVRRYTPLDDDGLGLENNFDLVVTANIIIGNRSSY